MPFFFMLYAFALLSSPYHLCSPITICHLALLSYSKLTYKANKHRLSCWLKSIQL